MIRTSRLAPARGRPAAAKIAIALAPAVARPLLNPDPMSWRKRLEAIAMAGGAVSMLAGCPVLGGFCGNANPDPCICGRPDNNPQDKIECDAEKACQAMGGTYEPYQSTTLPDGGVHVGSCYFPQDARPPDAGAFPDATLEFDAAPPPDAK